jgi:hypothetical protein
MGMMINGEICGLCGRRVPRARVAGSMPVIGAVCLGCLNERVTYPQRVVAPTDMMTRGAGAVYVEHSTKPRSVRVRLRGERGAQQPWIQGAAGLYPSVASAARACRLTPQAVQHYLAGRAGAAKSCPFLFEYAGGVHD